MSAKKIDLTGERFGRLVVIREAGRSKDGGVLWLCKCDCGREKVIRGVCLTRRKNPTVSCGCWNEEKKIKHGCAQKPWYDTYNAMMERCGHSKGASEYHLCLYRDRGITVCDLWQKSPLAFGDWLFAHGWRKGLQIDRIDNDKGYSPDNCRVVTPKENNNNRRDTLRLDDGTPLAMFCSSIGIDTRGDRCPTPKYNRIHRLWAKSHKIHPELMQALKDDTDSQSRLLEITKLKIRHAELMILAYKEILASKQTD